MYATDEKQGRNGKRRRKQQTNKQTTTSAAVAHSPSVHIIFKRGKRKGSRQRIFSYLFKRARDDDVTPLQRKLKKEKKKKGFPLSPFFPIQARHVKRRKGGG